MPPPPTRVRQGYWGPDQFLGENKSSIFPKKDPGNVAGGWVGGERGVKQFAARGENVADEDEQDALAPIIVGLAVSAHPAPPLPPRPWRACCIPKARPALECIRMVPYPRSALRVGVGSCSARPAFPDAKHVHPLRASLQFIGTFFILGYFSLKFI